MEYRSLTLSWQIQSSKRQHHANMNRSIENSSETCWRRLDRLIFTNLPPDRNFELKQSQRCVTSYMASDYKTRNKKILNKEKPVWAEILYTRNSRQRSRSTLQALMPKSVSQCRKYPVNNAFQHKWNLPSAFAIISFWKLSYTTFSSKMSRPREPWPSLEFITLFAARRKILAIAVPWMEMRSSANILKYSPIVWRTLWFTSDVRRK